jgi:hypothetical protein
LNVTHYTPARKKTRKKFFAGFPARRGSTPTTFDGAMKRHLKQKEN